MAALRSLIIYDQHRTWDFADHFPDGLTVFPEVSPLTGLADPHTSSPSSGNGYLL